MDLFGESGILSSLFDLQPHRAAGCNERNMDTRVQMGRIHQREHTSLLSNVAVVHEDVVRFDDTLSVGPSSTVSIAAGRSQTGGTAESP